MYSDEQLIENIRMNMEDFKKRNKIPENFAELIPEAVSPEATEVVSQFNERFCPEYKSIQETIVAYINETRKEESADLLKTIFRAEKLLLEYYYYCTRSFYLSTRKAVHFDRVNPLNVKRPNGLTISYGEYKKIATIAKIFINTITNVIPGDSCFSSPSISNSPQNEKLFDLKLKISNSKSCTQNCPATFEISREVFHLLKNQNIYYITASKAAEVANATLLPNIEIDSIRTAIAAGLKTFDSIQFGREVYYPLDSICENFSKHTWNTPLQKRHFNKISPIYSHHNTDSKEDWKNIFMTYKNSSNKLLVKKLKDLC